MQVKSARQSGARHEFQSLIRISITPAAFEAIAATLPLGSVGFEPKIDAKGQHLIWVEAAVADRLTAMRRPSESLSDVILRLVELEAKVDF